MDRLKAGTQKIIFEGILDYTDGFPNTPVQHLSFCFQTFYHAVAKDVYISFCNPVTELPQIESLDWGKDSYQ